MYKVHYKFAWSNEERVTILYSEKELEALKEVAHEMLKIQKL